MRATETIIEDHGGLCAEQVPGGASPEGFLIEGVPCGVGIEGRGGLRANTTV